MAFNNPASTCFGFNAGDVLVATPAGLQIAGVQLGLTPTDNLDALDVIPEPGTILPLAVGGAALYARRRLPPF